MRNAMAYDQRTASASASAAPENGSAPDQRLTPQPTVRGVPIAAIGDRDLAAWRELAADALEPNPFFEPEAVLPAAAVHGPAELVLIEAGDRLIGALPIVRAARWRKVPGACVAAWCHTDCFLGTPLLASDAPTEAIGALIDYTRHERNAGLLALEWLGTGGPVEAAVRSATAERGLKPIEYQAFDRAALFRYGPDEVHAPALSGKRRGEMLRKRRQLAEHLGDPVEVRDGSGDPEAIEGFLRGEASGWKARERTHYLRSPQHADLFRETCRRFAAAGRLQLFVLSAGGTDVAWKVNFESGNTVFGFKTAYDDAFAAFSPGAQLAFDFVQIFRDSSFATLDSCAAPDSELFNRLWPDRRPIRTLLVPTGGARGAAAAMRARAVHAVKRRSLSQLPSPP